MKRPIERLPAATSSATRAFALATSLLYACATPAASWTASWQASPQPVWAEDFLFPSNVPAELHDQTVRQLARISLGGTRVRIVLANTYGKRPIRIGRATLAKPGSERAAVATGSLHDVTFGGRRTATIAPGATLLSDPVAMPVAALSQVLVSLYLPAATPMETFHWDGRQTGWIVAGEQTQSHALQLDAADSQSTSARLLLTGILVETETATRTLVTLGDSITDGASAFYQSLGFHLGARYPTYAILQRGALELHLSLFEALEPKTNCSAAYLRLEDAQALHRQATALGLGGQGIPRITVLEDQSWGMREFALIDPDGNLLRVGQELDATPEQHRVRLASADDVPAVAALWQANVREAGETLDAGDQQAIQALLLAASRNRLLWLAEAQQHPRGFVLAHLWQIEDGQARVGEIAELYVLPQARRQGLARELVGSAEEALRSRGAGLIRAQSALDAPLSNLFWQGLGWDADYLTFTRY